MNPCEYSRSLKRRLPRRIVGARTTGFTLVELLVVIGIISTLAGLLMPAVTAARNYAYNTACVANLRSLAFAGEEYRTEFDRYVIPVSLNFPELWTRAKDGASETADEDRWVEWHTVLADRYISPGGSTMDTIYSARQVFQCPFDRPGTPNNPLTPATSILIRDARRMSYARMRPYAVEPAILRNPSGQNRMLEISRACFSWPYRLEDLRCVTGLVPKGPCLYGCKDTRRSRSALSPSQTPLLVENHWGVYQMMGGGTADVGHDNWERAPLHALDMNIHGTSHPKAGNGKRMNFAAYDLHVEGLRTAERPHTAAVLRRRPRGTEKMSLGMNSMRAINPESPDYR